MKQSLAVATWACSVSALVISPAQHPLTPGNGNQPASEDVSSHSWWDSLRHLASEASVNPNIPSAEDLESLFETSLDSVTKGVKEAVSTWNEFNHKGDNHAHEEDASPQDLDITGGHHGRKDFPDLTIYDMIKLSNSTKKFAKIVDDYPNVVKILNGTKGGNHTLFVPLDDAFEHVPSHPDDPDKEFIEQALLYHIGLGNLDALKLLKADTIPTAYSEKLIGDEAQRLRTSIGLGGLRLNFYNKVVVADFKGKNGIVHGIKDILVPPPMVGRLLTAFPAQFSTLLLAYEKTDFVDFIHDVKMTGSTVFAPSNSAFQKLGLRANAFLFNTDKGKKYLKAILKYHIVANATLYTDAFYDETTSDQDVEAETTGKREHFDLVTLLHDLHVSVDIAEWAGFKIVTVNGFSGLKVRDGIAKNGVIHVVDRVLIPPHKHKSGEMDAEMLDREIEVEELIERLSDYV